MQYEFHDAANIFPLDDEHIDDLAADIKSNGLQKPIELYEGKILDGRRRWMACQKSGIHPDTVGVHPEDPVAYVLSLNLHRRHLTKSEAGLCAARAQKLREKLEEKAKERMAERKGNQPGSKCAQQNTVAAGKTRDQLGAMFGVSGATVDRATQVLRDGVPELIGAVEDGTISISKAAGVSSHDPDVQRVLVDAAKERKSPQHKAEPKEGTTPDKPRSGKPPVGVILGNEAIDVLKRIPTNDPQRERGFQIVSDWIRKNK